MSSINLRSVKHFTFPTNHKFRKIQSTGHVIKKVGSKNVNLKFEYILNHGLFQKTERMTTLSLNKCNLSTFE